MSQVGPGKQCPMSTAKALHQPPTEAVGIQAQLDEVRAQGLFLRMGGQNFWAPLLVWRGSARMVSAAVSNKPMTKMPL